MADTQAAPLLDKLKADPANPDLLIPVGNLYYDAQQYPVAVDYYARALKVKPADAAVRTDMGTAFWFMGNADRAIAEFEKALTYVPNNPNTLFNLGLVKWKGKTDAAGAIAAWEKLLATDPNYEQKAQVEQMLGEARSISRARPPRRPISGRRASKSGSFAAAQDDKHKKKSKSRSFGPLRMTSFVVSARSDRSVLHRGAYPVHVLVRWSFMLNRIL